MVVAGSGGGNAWAKEMTLRRRMASIFNKTRDHFPYNDYLEEVEDMTFNLIEGIDVEAIESKIARYQQENAEQIYLSRAKRCQHFKKRALKVKEDLESAVPGVSVIINPEKPRRGCLEIREEGGEVFISLLNMPRPFTAMKKLDMDEVIQDIVKKIS